ncbi:MAG: TlpA family protein disulfide reductase, partial [Ktedonobacterales bacterium]
FLGVAVQTNQQDSLAFVQRFGIPYRIGPAPTGLAGAYGVTALPSTFVISLDGTLVYTFHGPVKADILATAIQSVEAG